MTTRSVLTGETGPRLAPFTLDPATALASLDRARRHRGRLGAARPRRRLDRRRREALRQIREAAAKGPLPPAADLTGAHRHQ